MRSKIHKKLLANRHFSTITVSNGLNGSVNQTSELFIAVENDRKEEIKWLKSTENKNILATQKEITPQAFINAKDMKEYILKRFLKNKIIDDENNDAGLRVISSLLTFPLSLAYGIHKLFPTQEEEVKQINSFYRNHLNIAILGARSESSLPTVWWSEIFYQYHSSFANIYVDMYGPGIITSTKTKSNNDSSGTPSPHTISWISPLTGDRRNISLLVDHQYSFVHHYHDNKNQNQNILLNKKVLFHDMNDCNDVLQWADIIVLYNPGFGSLALKSSWENTMRLLIQSRKPVICTAHGISDAQRDLRALDKLSLEEDDQELGESIEYILPPHENPFKSFKRTYDVNETNESKIVTTNFILYAFKGI
eukprot:gene9112-12291_t